MAVLLARRERQNRHLPEFGDLGPELLFSHRILEHEGTERLEQASDLHHFLEIELLVDVEEPVAVRSDPLADLFARLGDREDARARVEDRPPLLAPTPATSTSGARAPSSWGSPAATADVE